MFVLIADSGSTKTDWVILNGPKLIHRSKTIGFNPYFQSKDQIRDELIKSLKPEIKTWLNQIDAVYYYGSGCSTAEKCHLVEQGIYESLALKNIYVSHDLLAAARALCKNDWGIAAILGTGSNSCLYDGQKILENVPSTGYLWSDYGGGSQIGKFFIRDYFEENLPADLRANFEAAGYNREIILNNVYKNPLPSKYLAAVSLFVGKHLHHPKVMALLDECFDSFFIQQINKYTNSKNHQIHLVGSVAHFYKEMIKTRAQLHGYQIGNVLQSPIEGLMDFHSKMQ